MIQKVRIRGFKTALDVTLELGQLNVFVGANGAGKTNLFEAIALLGAAASGRVDQWTVGSAGMRTAWTPCRSLFKALKQQVITLEAWSNGAHYGASLCEPPTWTWTWNFLRENLVERGWEIAVRHRSEGSLFLDHGELIAINPDVDRGISPVVRALHRGGPLRVLLQALENFRIYIPNGATSESMKGVLIDTMPDLQQDRALWRSIVEEWCALTEWAEGALEQGLGFSDRYLHRDARCLSLGAADDGTRLVLYTLMLLLFPKMPRVFALKNADHALNPRLAHRLMARIQHILLSEPGRPQVLFATQRAEVLDALNLQDDRVRLFVVHRDESGATVVHRVEHQRNALATEHGETLSELWLSGALGGMPNL